ncbi:MAG: hypothetical protein ACRDK3_12390 [Actinomycetota bacterium]
MPEVSVSVELRVEVDQEADPLALEQAIWSEGRRAARELYARALKVLDETAVEQSGGARQRLEVRWVATLFGRQRIWRHRVRSANESWHPLDRVLGLTQAEASPGLREAVCDLSLRLPFRQTAEVSARITGEHMSAQSAWRILQVEGARLREEEGQLIESVFDAGEEPPDIDPPAIRRHQLQCDRLTLLFIVDRPGDDRVVARLPVVQLAAATSWQRHVDVRTVSQHEIGVLP